MYFWTHLLPINSYYKGWKVKGKQIKKETFFRLPIEYRPSCLAYWIERGKNTSTQNSNILKGLSHEMNLAFDDVLGQV
jgi:hypothetical protein